MKTKSFNEYLETRLSKEEIAEIKQKAALEVKFIKSIQNVISQTMANYMEQNKISFNELVKRLHTSPSHVAKIQSGEANLTIASMARLFALMGKEPSDVFKKIK